MILPRASNQSSTPPDVPTMTANGTDLEYYDYDITESFDIYDWAELIPPVIVYSIVLLTGIFGNGNSLYPIISSIQHQFFNLLCL